MSVFSRRIYPREGGEVAPFVQTRRRRYTKKQRKPMPTFTELLDRLLAHYEAYRAGGGEETENESGDLQPGLSDTEIDQLTAGHPYPLPPELRELYRWHNGQALDGPTFYLSCPYPHYWFLPLDAVLAEWRTLVDFAEEMAIDSPLNWNPAWFPVLKEDAYCFGVSCVPDADGEYPVVYASECDDTEKYARSLTHFVALMEETYRLHGVSRPEEDAARRHGCGHDLYPPLEEYETEGLTLCLESGERQALTTERSVWYWMNPLYGVAERLGVTPLGNFLGNVPEDFDAARAVLGPLLPAREEQWWAGDDGLTTVRALLELARTEPGAVSAEAVATLTELEARLTDAQTRGLRWHLR
jgi:cell wall assembly regulator SMI1